MLMRFDPFRELDRLSDQAWGGSGRRGFASMPLDAYRDGETFVVAFDLPGVDSDSIELTVERNVLNVTAERTRDEATDREWLVSERPWGRFHRQLFLGDTLDADRIEAGYDAGVLTLHIPVAEAAKPRRIEVAAGGRKTAIDAKSEAA